MYFSDGSAAEYKNIKKRQVYRKCTLIKFKHLMNYAITAAATYTT
jgi:hypothetical protein